VEAVGAIRVVETTKAVGMEGVAVMAAAAMAVVAGTVAGTTTDGPILDRFKKAGMPAFFFSVTGCGLQQTSSRKRCGITGGFRHFLALCEALDRSGRMPDNPSRHG
jgi:hypothetical protein